MHPCLAVIMVCTQKEHPIVTFDAKRKVCMPLLSTGRYPADLLDGGGTFVSAPSQATRDRLSLLLPPENAKYMCSLGRLIPHNYTSITPATPPCELTTLAWTCMASTCVGEVGHVLQYKR